MKLVVGVMFDLFEIVLQNGCLVLNKGAKRAVRSTG